MALFLFVLVLGAVFGAASALAGCTTNSFTIPSWLVQNYASQTSGNSTVAVFQAVNRATNVATGFRCLSSPSTATASGWQSCSAMNRTGSSLPLVADFQTNGYTAYFFFNETWACNDVPAKPLNFTAIGNSSVPITCSNDQSGVQTCRSTKPLLVEAELLFPMKITPARVDGPAGHTSANCTKTPDWEVEATQLVLNNATGKVQGGSAFVIVTNNNLGYTASCGGTFTAGAQSQPLACQGQTANERPDQYQIQTVVLFEPKTFGITVNQTWFCDVQDSSQPFSITATGSTNLSLDCQTFSDGTVYCTGDYDSSSTNTNNTNSGIFPGNITSHSLLPPYSLDDPLPTTDSCTISSVLSPAWWLSDFQTNTTTNHSDVVTVSFGMERQTGDQQPTGNVATIVTNGVRYASNASSSSSASAGVLPWYPCNIVAVGDESLAPFNCTFRYDMASRYLGLLVEWVCDNLDARSPVTFRGEVQTLLPNSTCVTSGTAIRCAEPNPTPWRANVTSLSWGQWA